MQALFDLQGKVAIVTGGSRGIGAMIAQGFVAAGAKTYITARKKAELEATAEELSKQGECIAISSDLSTMEGIEQFVADIQARESQVDILVNNAGATWGQGIDEFTEQGWDRVMDLNTKSIFFLSQKLLPLLRQGASAEDRSRIINIASINGLTNPNMDNYSYSASKAAVIHLTRHMAARLIKDDILVNGIAPGFFPSKMTAFILDHDEQAAAASVPAGRIGTPEDAAGTAIYLSSRASAFVNGHTIVLDGGQVANAH
ncbi:SDR family NAD(P)-dependent oxidoreductase [Pseudoteredinibacter isoporae]|uniref:2-deoxy-D-gluconate 3-dehydrogenase n=1 Tax=Pseudoteredinibacter isoporae TaxID=570281 RepID=A0A7X0MV31_9GAMM|nr:SDR family NAD(P)-dependent oxidoreductase [Pseudoteredinibacter isoporae]MBB6520650.1 2-deoxy-D-gluconate 3-dehydrogenase [Pseudoteredinibacter isoporae]NHO86217.1 SDR family oxidoreductase [Pseudoteredinibacter isoporae]NIB25332.1 SDR family oxidoreductase [Pseudoteredinibacter isoporae]